MMTQNETKLMFHAVGYLILMAAIVCSLGISSLAFAKDDYTHEQRQDRGSGGNRDQFEQGHADELQRKHDRRIHSLVSQMKDNFMTANPNARIDQLDDQSHLMRREARRFLELSGKRHSNMSCAPSATPGFVMVCTVSGSAINESNKKPSATAAVGNGDRQIAFRYLTPDIAQKYVKNMSTTPVAVNGGGGTPGATPTVSSVVGNVCTSYPCSDPSGFANYLNNNAPALATSSVGGLAPQSSVDFAVGNRTPASDTSAKPLGTVATGAAQ